MVTKGFVDATGEEMDRMRHIKRQYHPRVPDDAVEHCKHSYHAAKGDDETPDNVRFDDKGLFVCLCRHGIPVVLVNMDTPGEQQKYVIAALKRLFAMLPPSATVILLYDIACIVERSVQKVSHLSEYGMSFRHCISIGQHPILPDSISSRLGFATTAMHAYGHQWACQVIYNPRFQPGIGLTDGEAVERFWSKMRIIIGVERTSGVGSGQCISHNKLFNC
jgi:hypothetical protein